MRTTQLDQQKLERMYALEGKVTTKRQLAKACNLSLDTVDRYANYDERLHRIVIGFGRLRLEKWRTKIEQVKSIVDAGGEVVAACEKIGIAASTYYRAGEALGIVVKTKRTRAVIRCELAHHYRLQGMGFHEACSKAKVSRSTYVKWCKETKYVN